MTQENNETIKDVVTNVFRQFKQASVFNIVLDRTVVLNDDKDLLLFQPCDPVEYVRFGFLPLTTSIDDFDYNNVESNDVFSVEVGSWTIYKVGLSEKKIPAKEVDKLVKVKIKEHKERFKNGYEEFEFPSKDQLETFKDTAKFELAPKCFNDDSEHLFAINAQDKLLVSLTNKEDLVRQMFEYHILTNKEGVSFHKVAFDTNLFKQLALGRFEGQTTATDYIELQDESGILVSKKENVESSSEVELALENNKDVVKIGVDYDGVFTARVSGNGSITNIKFDKIFTYDVSDSFSSSALLFLSELIKMVNELKEETKEV